MPPKLAELLSDLPLVAPDAAYDVRGLPSGVVFIDVSTHGRDFVLEYSPRQGVGVSENFEDTPPFVGHDQAFASLPEGIARFKQLLAEAAHSPRPEPEPDAALAAA